MCRFSFWFSPKNRFRAAEVWLELSSNTCSAPSILILRWRPRLTGRRRGRHHGRLASCPARRGSRLLSCRTERGRAMAGSGSRSRCARLVPAHGGSSTGGDVSSPAGHCGLRVPAAAAPAPHGIAALPLQDSAAAAGLLPPLARRRFLLQLLPGPRCRR